MSEVLKPNAGQHEAAEAFFDYLFRPEKEFGLSGAGGVGKSFWVSYIIDTIITRYLNTCKIMGIEPEFDEVIMTATTNKAAEVLAEATNRPVKTIHSFMNLKVYNDFQTGNSKIERTRNWMVHQRKIIFIDECSMIDTPLDKMIQEGTLNCKIVYVGDMYQLAPVKEKISPIYTRGIKFFELTEQMRNNSQPALMNVCDQLRESVRTGKFWPITIVPGVIDYMDDDDLAEGLDFVFKPQDHTSRILAYTNNRVIEYNDHIRTLRQLPDEFIVGEKLINNSAVQFPSGMLSVEAEVTIDHLSTDTETIQLTPTIDMEVRRATISNKYGIPFSNVLLPVDKFHFSELVKYFKREKIWERYYHLTQTYPDLRQRDASTVHKIQGSSTDTVFIDLANISKVTVADVAARMLYVAFSRPRHRIFLYGNLTDRFGGLTY